MQNETKSIQVPESCLFLKIFQTFRMAIHPNKLIIAFSAVVVICLVGVIMDLSKSVATTSSLAQGRITELQIYLSDPAKLESFITTHGGNDQSAGVFATMWNFAAVKFHAALNELFSFNLPGVAANMAEYLKAVGWAVRYHPLYCVIFAVVKLVVIAVAGGAICRIAALQFAKGQKPGISEAIRFSCKKFWSFVVTPIAPACIILFFAFFVFLLGLIGNIPVVGELLIGIFAICALLAGAFIALLLIGTAAGFNLMFPAIACDGSDCFDAISRSFNYIYSRPWRMGFYTAVAAVYGAVCYTFVRFFAFLMILGARTCLRLVVFVENSNQINKLTAIWPAPSFTNLLGFSAPAPAGAAQSFAAFLIYLFLLLVVALLVSFIISFYFSANTIIYSLLRNKVDNTALEDVYVLPEQAEAEIETAEQEKPDKQKDPETKAD